MGNLKTSKGLGRIKRSIIRFSVFSLCAALIASTIFGCIKDKVDVNAPPGFDQIFPNYFSGTSLGPEPGVVIIDDSIAYSTNIPEHPFLQDVRPICYRVYEENDEIMELTASNFYGDCAGVKMYSTGIFFRCNDQTTTVDKILQLWYQWDNDGEITNEEHHLRYSLDCVEPPPGAVRYRVSGGGLYWGGIYGRVYIIDGFALMDPGQLKNPPPTDPEESLYKFGEAVFTSTTIIRAWDHTEQPPFRALDFDTTRKTTVTGTWDSVYERFDIITAKDVAENCQSRGAVDFCEFANVGIEVNIPLPSFSSNPIQFDNTYELDPLVQGITEFRIDGVSGSPLGNINNYTDFSLKTLAH